MRRGPNRPK